MYLQRTSRLLLLLRPQSTTIIKPRYASTQAQQPGQNVEGESGKSPDKAQPKILQDSPPSEAEAPQDVKEHNRQMDGRADKPREKVKEEDVQKDKVSKGFWSGEGSVKGGTQK